MNITLPVNSSDPASTTIIKPTGNTAPNTNFSKPIGAPALSIPALATTANKPPNAIYAPAKKESNITFTISKNMKLVLIFGNHAASIKVDGIKYTDSANNYLEIELVAGTHTITKADSTNLYYIILS